MTHGEWGICRQGDLMAMEREIQKKWLDLAEFIFVVDLGFYPETRGCK